MGLACPAPVRICQAPESINGAVWSTFHGLCFCRCHGAVHASPAPCAALFLSQQQVDRKVFEAFAGGWQKAELWSAHDLACKPAGQCALRLMSAALRICMPSHMLQELPVELTARPAMICKVHTHGPPTCTCFIQGHIEEH